MKNMMSGPMNPKEMPKKMAEMMKNMMGGMAPEERMSCMRQMMPQCMNMMFSQMEPEKRSAFAAEMISRMCDELKKHAAGATKTDDTDKAEDSSDE